MKFKTGQVVMTRAIADKIDESSKFSEQVMQAFGKYVTCDWGDTCEEDKALNNESVENGERILAAYETCEGKIWIITEWDRSVTTILFPEDY